MNGARPRVICADDHEDNRALVEASLEDEGLELVSCTSGEQAITAFREGGASCVLLDVRMPGKDGFETLRAIRALPGGADVPALFLTALRDLETFDRALDAGAEFLAKPVRPTELVVRVRTLLRLNELSAEVRAHHDALSQQRDAMMRLQLEKELLTSFLVHDLKSPASSIHLHAELLLRDKSLSADARESAAAIKALSARTTQLARDLLDLTRADEGRLEIARRPVSWRELGEQAGAAFALAARSRGLEIAVEIGKDAIASGDADMLQRLLDNLLDNAVRHAPTGSVVRIEGACRGDVVELRVANEGEGIAAVDRERIFDRFAQAGGSHGHGLGLAFCRLAADRHGGSIHVDPERPGAVFVVRLPRHEERS